MPRRRMWRARMLGACAALAAFADASRALAAPALMPVGSPVSLPGGGSFHVDFVPDPYGALPAPLIAESPVDGSFELAEDRELGYVPYVSFTVEMVHSSSGGQESPAVAASQMLVRDSGQFVPTVAGLRNGGFVVVWQNGPTLSPGPAGGRQAVVPSPLPGTAGDPFTVSARVLDSSGQPVGAEIQLSPNGGTGAQPFVAASSSGGFVVSWIQYSSFTTPGALTATVYSATGQALTGPIAIGAVGRNLGLVGLADGGFIAAWGAPGGAGIAWQRFNAAGTAITPAVQAVSVDFGGPVLLAANPTGQIALGWMTTNPALQAITSVVFQMYGASGAALGPPITVAATVPSAKPVLGGLAVNLQGQTLVAWAVETETSAFPVVQLFDASGAPAGTPLSIEARLTGPNGPQAVIAENDGNWNLIVGNLNDAFVQTLSAASCSPSALSLCLDDNRFRFDVQFSNPLTGATSAGNPVPLSAGAGALWFFDASLPELVVKVIDGTAVNGHFWVFFASVTNVEFDLTVTDTQTAAQRIYHNAAGTLASQADTDFPLAPAPPARPAIARPALTHPAIAPTTSPVPPPTASARPMAAAEPTCSSSETGLCLLGSELAVTVTFQDSAGSVSAAGKAVQLSAAGGYFWFFGPDDSELVVKVIDGRVVNGHIWVFYASLTNVEFDLTVTDSLSPTHASRTYHNSAGTLASAVDVSAF
ncbi:MAG TPA: hypothetical protein VHG32_14965 [Thermoanaerobaculia bacterium]|nr:hypothetical protein [Thermoanaerobaculia bacterium]